MNTNSQQEDTDESKVKNGMNQNGSSTRLKIAKLYTLVTARNLNEQAWR